MSKATYLGILFLAVALVLTSSAGIAAPAAVKKSVQKIEDGNYLIKLVITSKAGEIFAFELKDPKNAIVDVYSPKSWCMLTDGEACHSRTASAPIGSAKGIEFITDLPSEPIVNA